MIRSSFLFLLALAALAQNTATYDSRLRVSTIVREDLFAGFMVNDMVRFERGEKTLDELLPQRPQNTNEVLAWKGGAALYRSVLAHENGNAADFERHYANALGLFKEAEAAQSSPDNIARQAITGGTLVIFGDRLPEKYRTAAWTTAYDMYGQIWKAQAAYVTRLPVHARGELLAGLVLSSQRLGKAGESGEHLDRMLTMLQGTPYEAGARKWKESPAAATKVRITCVNCHDGGRLEATRAALDTKQ